MVCRNPHPRETSTPICSPTRRRTPRKTSHVGYTLNWEEPAILVWSTPVDVVGGEAQCGEGHRARAAKDGSETDAEDCQTGHPARLRLTPKSVRVVTGE